ncbi:hypothetical protein N7468_009215 [Penicillium chermesinum]|uniref:Uncharacterized protein n=1 Tax=Penicillium chermesinum TaxID=63820 RepID=A0A9W9TER4_9EURO|nr:uncharacterized protein N7468_009215 [Penicillium chermesinum]KAJ5220011.1 hypothetical protein N7468_009215 [Penicillium chermesinum]
MQVAEILSDLTSLRVCGYNEALALVNAQASIQNSEASAPDSSTDSTSEQGAGQVARGNADLQRAKELVALHYEMKSKNANGEVDAELRRAREQVKLVLAELS